MDIHLLEEIKALCLGEPRWTLSVAESLTCGHVQALIGSISGASEFFEGGLTAYSLEQKVTLLGVDRERASLVDCVSAQVAEQMAVGVARRFGTTWSVATTGYAEPTPGRGVHTPYAWWAIAYAQTQGPENRPGVGIAQATKTGVSAEKVASGAPPPGAENRWLVRAGRVDCPGNVKRVDVQRWVAEAAVTALASALRAERGE